MSPSVADNSKFRCRGCGGVVDEQAGWARNKPCPSCGGQHFDQLVVTPVCDFCSAVLVGPTCWRYLAQTMAAIPVSGHPARTTLRGGAPIEVIDDEWCACADCHADFERGDHEAVQSRAVAVAIKNHPELPEDMVRAAIQKIHDAFRATRLDEPPVEESLPV